MTTKVKITHGQYKHVKGKSLDRLLLDESPFIILLKDVRFALRRARKNVKSNSFTKALQNIKYALERIDAINEVL